MLLLKSFVYFHPELQEQINEIQSSETYLLPRQDKRLKQNVTFLQTKVNKAEKVRSEIRLAKADPAYLKSNEIQLLERKQKAIQDIFRKIQGPGRLESKETFF